MKATIILADGITYTIKGIVSVTSIKGKTAITYWNEERNALITSTYGEDMAIVITAGKENE